MFDVKKLSAIQIGLASPDEIRRWSHGEVTKPETINYRSQKPEEGGLFCERIFGPSKDYECHCGKYKKIRYAGQVCEKCGVEITTKDVRRERMGHIELAAPCTHIWYLKGIPSRVAILLDISPKTLESVAYYAGHLCLNPGKSTKLSYKEYIDERVGREIFIPALEEIRDNPEFGLLQGTDDAAYLDMILASLQNPSEVFPYQSSADLISKYAGAEFGEGASAIKQLLKDIDLEATAEELDHKVKEASTEQARTKYAKRLEVVQAFLKSNNKPEWMILDCIPVIPPDLRPMLALDGGRFATSDLNDLYRRVISRNNRLKKMLDMNAPQVILMNEKRMLQEAVDALIDNGRRNRPVSGSSNRPLKSLSSGLKGKQGRFRQNLLGKRVDYSGRSVIAVGPDLKMYQCGIPREMAVQLLRPFIVCELLKRGIASSHKQADKIVDRYEDCVLDIVDEIINQHPVLLNRAPTLHRLGIQAFQPVLVDGRAIRLHPLVCTGFNADFDGDQMAVHVPLSKAAQEEALDLMLASNNILGPKDGKPICVPSQDIILGNYYLTMESTADEFFKHEEDLRAVNDLDEADRYHLYGLSEGKLFRTVNDVILAYQTKQIHLHNRIAIPGSALLKSTFTEEQNNSYVITSVGRIIFNLILPADFPYVNTTKGTNLQVDDPANFVPKGTDVKSVIASMTPREPFKKGDLSDIIDEVFRRYDRQGNPKTSSVVDKMKDQGYQYATIAGFTIAMSDIPVFTDKQDILKEGDEKVNEINEQFDEGLLTEDERHKLVCRVWDSDKGATKLVSDKLKVEFEKDQHNNIYIFSKSGARGKWSNILQLAGMRGLMGNTSGGTIELPVKSCFREGMKVSEFFIATHGARKGGSDTALRTADSGYLTRRLVDVSQDVIVKEEDCHTDHGFVIGDIINVDNTGKVEVVVKLKERLVGRYSLNEIVNPTTGEVIVPANTLIDEELAEEVEKAGVKEVEIRSLFGCQAKGGVCVHCYGRNIATGRLVQVGEAVGIMAAQSIGEPGTQLTMRTFHTGGVAGSDITQGLPRVTELFEARNPKGQALIAKISGTVTDVKSENGYTNIYITKDNETIEHRTPYGADAIVKKGDVVENGQCLTRGAISPKELLSYADTRHVQQYILEEVQKVYRAQEIGISDKHIEVIVRQMLRKVQVIDAGDTNLISGTRVSVQTFTQENAKALAQGKRPAFMTPLILGITKAALETDSFLSAASFQETTRVLTDAAIKGKVDHLHGLKENVITGRLIPAGRGLLSDAEEDGLLQNFSVEGKLKEVSDRYVEEHDRAVQQIHEKIRNLQGEGK